MVATEGKQENGSYQSLKIGASIVKVNRDRYNIDAPGCKKKAYMDLDFRTLNGSEI